ncbi:MAG: D-tyrosyl-tRNA(Tyr) deacylase [Clostridia bacterium]|nr:D-tyrosyl-tRNA(Tyr) deacylase [Clostridia bacterium]
MRALIQRVRESAVSVDGETIGKISQGLNILLGVFSDDTEEDLRYLLKKIPLLRIFSDENGKMNLSVLDIGGEALVISQFTLCADTKKGNRPSYVNAAAPEFAEDMYERFIEGLKLSGIRRVEHGRFGADMKVEILNDGPVTIILDSKNK